MDQDTDGLLTRRRRRLIDDLQSPEAREGFVEEGVTSFIGMQIREIRESKGWTQQELANRCDMHQSSIGRLESDDYHGYSVETLRRVALAFDVGLQVLFVPFSKLVDDAVFMDERALCPPSYAEDEELNGDGVRLVHTDITVGDQSVTRVRIPTLPAAHVRNESDSGFSVHPNLVRSV